ncbi:MAG TPA: nucleotidyltransferase family protein [Burkholderiaceae bacterium]|nr:nucleotidyltransferase family protein [Burkholderiaceae bacterium]
MRAMILAAGRGERLRPRTDICPKPLLDVGGKPLIVWQIERLRSAGIIDIAINLSWLGDQIEAKLGDGRQFNVRLRYSYEPEALETGGGVATALPLLGNEPFVCVSADVWCEYDYSGLRRIVAEMNERRTLAHLILVPNPDFHPEGDFALDIHVDDAAEAAAALADEGSPHQRYTFGNIGIYHPKLFDGVAPGTRMKLVTLFRRAMARRLVTGEVYHGRWHNIGTEAQLIALDAALRESSQRATSAEPASE